MTKTLELTLPVMLHSDTEVPIFLVAKERLEALGERYGVPIQVGAFLPYMPGKSRSADSFEKQLQNQAKYRLPIRLVETGIQKTESLTYVREDQTYDSNVPSDLDRTIDQVAKLRDLDPNPKENLVVAPHVGPMVIPRESGAPIKPALYSPADFLLLRDKLYGAARDRFTQLQERGKKQGLVLAIENAYPAVYEDVSFWQTGGRSQFETDYQVFNDLPSLLGISQGNLVLDVAHLFSVRDLQNQFARQNKISPKILFDTMDVSSWDEFSGRIGKLRDYMAHAHALHISQVDGVGVRVPKDHEGAKVWGGAKQLHSLISNEIHVSILKEAIERGLPVNIEEDYAFKPLTFNEADEFLEPILKAF